MSGLRPLLLISIPILAVLVTLLIMIKIIGTGDTTGGNKDLFPRSFSTEPQPTATMAAAQYP